MEKHLPLLVFLYRSKIEIVFFFLMGSWYSNHNSFRKESFRESSNWHVIHEFAWERKWEVYTSLLMWLTGLYEQAPLEYVLGTPFRTGIVDSFLALNTLPLSAILPRATNDPFLNKVRHNLYCPRPTQALTQLHSPFPKIETQIIPLSAVKYSLWV